MEQVAQHFPKLLLIHSVLNRQQVNVAVWPRESHVPSLGLQFIHLYSTDIRFDGKGDLPT